MRQSPVFIFSLCITLLTGIGCQMKSKKDPWQPIKQKGAPFVHVVEYPKETLEVIAKWYTGDGKNLDLLAGSNPNINPDHLVIGDEVFLPDSLVKTRKPMPEEFISEFYQEKKKKATTIKASKITEKKSPEKKEAGPLPQDGIEEDFEVFGPK